MKYLGKNALFFETKKDCNNKYVVTTNQFQAGKIRVGNADAVSKVSHKIAVLPLYLVLTICDGSNGNAISELFLGLSS